MAPLDQVPFNELVVYVNHSFRKRIRYIHFEIGKVAITFVFNCCRFGGACSIGCLFFVDGRDFSIGGGNGNCCIWIAKNQVVYVDGYRIR